MKTFAQLVLERGPKCESGSGKTAQDRHHFLIHQVKENGKSKYPILDDERNLVLVNHHDHVTLKKFDNAYWRNEFYKINIKRYGMKAMQEWIAEVKATTKLHKSRFNFTKG